MKTGADDDNLSTPILAFIGSSACAVATADQARNPISAARAQLAIRFLRIDYRPSGRA
jgi:hypothetical protein